MAVLPSSVNSTPNGFEPAFAHVGVQGDRHACLLACIATISGTTLEDVFRNAEALGMTKTGPYYQRLNEEFLASLGACYGWVFTVWKEVTEQSQLPDLCIAMVEYDIVWEAGRTVILHRAKASHNAKLITYAIDPSATDSSKQIRTDIQTLAPAWYIGIHPMKTGTAKK